MIYLITLSNFILKDQKGIRLDFNLKGLYSNAGAGKFLFPWMKHVLNIRFVNHFEIELSSKFIKTTNKRFEIFNVLILK